MSREKNYLTGISYDNYALTKHKGQAVDILNEIRDSNPTRDSSLLERRLIKLGEEYGELAQALLSVTSPDNPKCKTWDDVREELSDVVIVALDMLFTIMPDEKGVSDTMKRYIIESWIQDKLKKWRKSQSNHSND